MSGQWKAFYFGPPSVNDRDAFLELDTSAVGTTEAV